MLTIWYAKATLWLQALVTDTRTRLRDERGALGTAELLGLIIIVLAVLALVGPAVMDYIQSKLGALR
jgi:hypothetical protein